jgi:hypothetical protein
LGKEKPPVWRENRRLPERSRALQNIEPRSDLIGAATDLRRTARQGSLLSRSGREMSPLRQHLHYPNSEFLEHFERWFFCDNVYQYERRDFSARDIARLFENWFSL